MKYTSTLFAAVALACLAPTQLQAHCQVPCGIYDDNARVQTMLEDAATIKKAINQLGTLAGKSDAQSLNQATRWVTNKEKHAQNVIETISNYFLTQRVKPSSKDYTERLTKHHAVILLAMKAKQNSSAEVVEKLTKAIKALEPYYSKK